jgi:integrase
MVSFATEAESLNLHFQVLGLGFRRCLTKAGLPSAGLHVTRPTAAKLRRDAGESIEDVSRFLDHSSLAVTTTYLRRLEGQEDRGWGRVAEAIGV